VTIDSWDESNQTEYDVYARPVDLSCLENIKSLHYLKHLNLLICDQPENRHEEFLDSIADLQNLELATSNSPRND